LTRAGAAVRRTRYGGKDFITPDGKLHTDDPKVREAAVKRLVKLTTPL
jgi:hypothetical protein